MRFKTFVDPSDGKAYVQEVGQEGFICEAFAWCGVSAEDNASIIALGLAACAAYAREELDKRKARGEA